MTEVFDHSLSTGTTRLVLLAFADNADRNTRECWPKLSDVARRARCDLSTVKRARDELVELGELEIVERGGGRGHPTRYRIPR